MTQDQRITNCAKLVAVQVKLGELSLKLFEIKAGSDAEHAILGNMQRELVSFNGRLQVIKHLNEQGL